MFPTDCQVDTQILCGIVQSSRKRREVGSEKMSFRYLNNGALRTRSWLMVAQHSCFVSVPQNQNKYLNKSLATNQTDSKTRVGMMVLFQMWTVTTVVNSLGQKLQDPNGPSNRLLQGAWSTDVSIEHPVLPVWQQLESAIFHLKVWERGKEAGF